MWILLGDVSIATANYLYRHGFNSQPVSTPKAAGPKKKKEIINFAELEKIEKYT